MSQKWIARLIWANSHVVFSLSGFVVFNTGRFMLSLTLLFVLMLFFSVLFRNVITSLRDERDGLYDSDAFVCWFCTSFFSSAWCWGLAAAYDCGSPWTFLLNFMITSLEEERATVAFVCLFCMRYFVSFFSSSWYHVLVYSCGLLLWYLTFCAESKETWNIKKLRN